MFKVTTKPIFWADVIFKLPDDGHQTEHRFRAQFKFLGLQAFKDLNFRCRQADAAVRAAQELALASGSEPEPVDDGDQIMVSEVLLGWDALQDEQGGAFAFNVANRDAIMDIVGVRQATVQAFLDGLTGARQKN